MWVPSSRAHDRWWSSGMCAPRAAVSGETEEGVSLPVSLCQCVPVSYRHSRIDNIGGWTGACHAVRRTVRGHWFYLTGEL